MLQAMIVEHNVSFREKVRTLVDWEKYGFRLAAEAADGKQALEIMSLRQIDLVLAGIDIPDMGGIDLIKVMSRRFPDTKTLVFSSHDDFRYATEAFRTGASDFVLQHELEPRLLGSLLRRTAEAIGKGWASAAEHQRMEKESREHAFRRHLLGEAAEDPMLPELMPDPFRKNAHIVLLFSAAESSGHVPRVMPLLHRYAVNGDGVSVVPVRIGKQVYALVLGFGAWRSGASLTSCAYDAARSVIANAAERGIHLTAGISRPGRGPDVFTGSYMQAKTALFQQVYGAAGRVYSFETDVSGEERLISPSLIKELTIAMKASSRRDIETAVDRLFAELVRLRPESAVVRRMLLDLYAWLHVLAAENERGESCVDQWNADVHVSLERFDKPDQWKSAFLKACGEVFGSGAEHPGKRREIAAALQYIHAHYREDISVAQMSRELHLSANYLSNLFKAETGKRIVEYINGFRIEMAKRLLLDSGVRVYEAAEKTGFGEVSYFCKVFKEVTGRTVSDYRKESVSLYT